MRPKPSRDWVMVELERLGVRVVSGRLGRKAGEDGEDDPMDPKKGGHPGGMSIGGPIERNSSMGFGGEMDLNALMARRNSSIGMSMMGDTMNRRGSLGSLGQTMGMDGDPSMPPHRPFVGGGAAAAYEASRHDHYTQKSAEQQRRASSLGLGNLTGGGLGNMGMSVNPNQHYEMLKLHHMNLLNEIQETTLMMNLYQQQQLQQQQHQLQQQAGPDGMGNNGDPGLGMMQQQLQNSGSSNQQGLDQMFGSAQLSQQQRASLGLGGPQMGGGNTGGGGNYNSQQQFQLMQQQMEGGMGGGGQGGVSSMGQSGNQVMESRLAQLKDDLARGRTQGDKMGSSSSPGATSPGRKRTLDKVSGSSKKRSKPEEEDNDDDDDEEDGSK
jgi:hypothetical protein